MAFLLSGQFCSWIRVRRDLAIRMIDNEGGPASDAIDVMSFSHWFVNPSFYSLVGADSIFLAEWDYSDRQIIHSWKMGRIGVVGIVEDIENYP